MLAEISVLSWIIPRITHILSNSIPNKKIPSTLSKAKKEMHTLGHSTAVWMNGRFKIYLHPQNMLLLRKLNFKQLYIT